MDPLRIALRALFAYLVLLLLLRLSGKRTVYQGSAFDFVLALVLGDMVDNVLWQEISIAEFLVAVTTIVLMRLALTARWRRVLRHNPVSEPPTHT